MNKSFISLMLFGLILFISTYFICSFFGSTGRMVITHLTGVTTMSLALIAGFVAKYSNLPIAEKVAACASSLLMFIAYFMYIFFEISPSINNEVMHSISSNLLDWATSGLLLFVILTAYIYKGK